MGSYCPSPNLLFFKLPDPCLYSLYSIHEIRQIFDLMIHKIVYCLCVFTARRYAQARSLLPPGVSPSVCPSLRMSVTLVHCIQMAEDIVKLFCRPHHSSFLNLSTGTQFQGEPLQRGRKIQGSGEILRFLTEIAIYLGNSTRYARGCYETSIGSHMRSIEWWHFQDLEGP